MLTLKQILDIAAYAGKIMLINGAEIYRTEDTISRICRAYGVKDVQSLVTPTGIFISIDAGDGNVETVVRRISQRSLNLKKIGEVNAFSRSLQSSPLWYDAAMEELKQISYSKNEYSINLVILISSFGAAMNVLVMGADWLNIVPAFFGSVIAQFVIRKIGFLKGVNFVPQMIAGFICGVVALESVRWGLGDHSGIIIVSAILPFVPGVALTNAIRDAISDDLISASSRGTEAGLISISIAIGVAIALGVFK